jgi:hypothetical protein
MQEVAMNPIPLDVIVATKGDVVTAELDIRHNAAVRVGDQFIARWDDGGITILRVIGFESAESFLDPPAQGPDPQ